MNPHSNYIDKKNEISFDSTKYNFHVIKKNTLLYRAQPEINNMSDVKPMICSDTGKCGTYFASQPFISIAMLIEYQKLMKLGVFRVTDNITIANGGKYGFREINPERYFDQNGQMILDVNPLPSENISHLDCEIEPLDEDNTIFLNKEKYDIWETQANCEVFLIPSELKKIKLEKVFRFNVKDATELKKKIIMNGFPLDLKTYVDNKILV